MERFIFERVKSLNYNMYTAFGRLDQMLKNIELKLDNIETKLNTEENVDKSTS